jgi:hypothetical protein
MRSLRPAVKAAATTVLIVGALVVGAMLLVSPSDAVTTGKSCKDIAVGPDWGPTVNVPHHPATVTVTAPTGYLIDQYCVKSGGGADAAVLVTVQPPAAEVVIDHPTRPTVNQYVLHLVPVSSVSGGPSTPPGTGGPSTPPGSSGPSTPPGSSGPSAPATG